MNNKSSFTIVILSIATCQYICITFHRAFFIYVRKAMVSRNGVPAFRTYTKPTLQIKLKVQVPL